MGFSEGYQLPSGDDGGGPGRNDVRMLVVTFVEQGFRLRYLISKLRTLLSPRFPACIQLQRRLWSCWAGFHCCASVLLPHDYLLYPNCAKVARSRQSITSLP